MSIEQKIIRNLELEIERLHGRVNDAGDSLREYMSLVRDRDEEIGRLREALWLSGTRCAEANESCPVAALLKAALAEANYE